MKVTFRSTLRIEDGHTLIEIDLGPEKEILRMTEKTFEKTLDERWESFRKHLIGLHKGARELNRAGVIK